MSKLIDINTLNKNNDYINDNINARLIDNASKNLFDYNKWVGTVIYNGTAIYENYGVTLTANGHDCYTNYGVGQTLHIPVQANKKYILSWDCTSENSDLTEDRVFIFFNGLNDYNIQAYAIDKQLQFTVPDNITFITIRFGVQENGNTVSYSNIMIRRAEIIDNTFEPYYRTNKQLDADLTDISNYVNYTDDIYGLEVDYENNIFTRLAGAANKTGGSDFNNINAYNRRRCNLTDDGVVTAYYGDTEYTETGVLTQAVTVDGTEYPIGTPVQVMVEQPKFYYKVVPLKLESYTTQNGDIGYHIRKARYYISDTPKNGFKLHPAFIRNGAEKEKIYLSAYEGSLYDVSENTYITDDAQVADFNADKMSSIANVKPMSGLSQNLTRPNTRKLAQNRGVGWEQMYVHTASATQLLFMIEYGTLNSQTAIGSGVVNKASGSGNEAENTGGTSSLGNVSGSVSNNEISYRGEENVWGNIWAYEDGINIQNPNPFNDGEYGNAYISDNNFSDDTNSLPYEDTNIYPCKTAGSGSYISAFGYNEKFDWLFIPTEVTGNLSLPVGDAIWNFGPGWHIAGFGGGCDNGSTAGLFILSFLVNFSTHSSRTNGRLVYIPNANESNRNLKQIDKDLTAVETYTEYIEIAYSDLKNLCDNGTLIPSATYRITDYITTTVQPETQSAGNQFDVIVVADSTNTLNENASAIQHTTETTDYFYTQKLNAWKLKYDINNNTNKYAWADSTNGKGVIYEMEDEYGNKCGYDFKNIRFKRYKITSEVENLSNFTNEYLGSKLITNNTLVPSNYNIDENDNVYRYTFDFNNTDATLNINNSSSDIYCYNNIIEHYAKNNSYTSSKYYLNNIVLYCDPQLCKFYNNYFEMNNCNTTINGHINYSIIFKGGCYNNIVTNGIYKAVFGVRCYNNIIGDNNCDITFGNECDNNLLLNDNFGIHFGENCSNNTLYQTNPVIMEDDCFNNSITESSRITLRNGCYNNNIEDVSNITMGVRCYSNNIKNASDITIGNSCFRNNITEQRRCDRVIIGNYCSNNTIASSAILRNVIIGNRCSNNTVVSGITLSNVIIKDFCENVTFSEDLNNIEYTTIWKGNDIQVSYILSGAYKGKDLTKTFAHEIADYSNDPWLWYQAREAAGNYSGIYVGDYIPFTGKTFYSPNSQGDCTSCTTKDITYHAHILGINVYRGTYQGNIFGNNKEYLGNHTDWICKECLTNSEDFYWTSEEVNSSYYTNNGTSAQQCPYLLSDIYKFYHSMETSGLSNYLPSSLANMIINKTLHLEQRYVDANRNATESTGVSWNTNIGKIWTPTEFEIFGATIMATPKWSCINAIQYPYFRNWRNRQLTYDDGTFFADWWSASVCSGYSGNAVRVGSSGGGAYWSELDGNNTYPLCFRTGLSSDALYNDYPS